MNTFLHDLRYAVRILRKTPLLTCTALLMLALGIGANTVIFSVVNAVLLRPLPFPHSSRLVWMTEMSPPPAGDRNVNFLDYQDWLQLNHSFQKIGMFASHGYNLTGAGEPRFVAGQEVTANLFSILGIHPVLGRSFSAAEDRAHGRPVGIISHSIWQQAFGDSPSVLGRTLQVSGQPVTVIGVMPAGFQLFIHADIFLPYQQFTNSIYLQSRDYSDMTYAVARMKPGVTLAMARTDMEAIARRLRQAHPASNRHTGVVLESLQAHQVGQVRPVLLILLSAVGLILLIVCANVAGLLLVRANSRRKEMSIRAALGANAWRLARQALTESLLLAVTGGVLGLLLALGGLHLVRALLPAGFPRAAQIAMDLPMLAFTLAVALLTGVLSGLAPAVQVLRRDLNAALKEGGRQPGTGRPRLHNGLVIAEVALAVVLLAGAGLLIRSLRQLERVYPGFDAHHVVTVSVALNPSAYPDPVHQGAFVTECLRRIRALPGVTSAASVYPVPMTPQANQTFVGVEGWVPREGELDTTDFTSVSPGYFHTLRIPLIAGRDFTWADSSQTAKVALVDRTMADHYWPGLNPIGRHLRLFSKNYSDTSSGMVMTVIGVVEPVKTTRFDLTPDPQVYFSSLQVNNYAETFLVRSALPPARLIPAVRAQVQSVDPTLPLFHVRSLDDLVRASLATQRLGALLLTAFSGLALLLAAAGLFGVMSYVVGQRTREMGLRLALGAQPAQLRHMVVGQGMRLVLAGLLAGLAASALLLRLLRGQLYGVHADDPVTFATVVAVLLAAALVACSIPALRASRADPMITLRSE